MMDLAMIFGCLAQRHRQQRDEASGSKRNENDSAHPHRLAQRARESWRSAPW